jgi:LacI family transcriptional regulator
MSSQPRVTIKEIAEEAGVSQQTVSRVLNNRPDVAAETRQRIKEIIAKWNYQPSSIARGLTQGQSYILGVVSAGLGNYGPARTLAGVEQQACELNYTLILRVSHDPTSIDIDEHLRYLISHHVDGIIWTLPDIGNIRDDLFQIIPSINFPIVFTNMQLHPDLVIVDYDHVQGGQIATEHLISQGYKSIAVITGPMDWMVSRHRYRGWEAALDKAGLKRETTQVVEGDWSALSGEQGFVRLLDQQPDMDALFVSNDRMALGAMRAARRLNIRIPEDIALVGYDDIPDADYFAPPLTTVRQDPKESACLAVELVDQMINQKDWDERAIKSKTKLFSPKLIVRESSLRV